MHRLLATTLVPLLLAGGCARSSSGLPGRLQKLKGSIATLSALGHRELRRPLSLRRDVPALVGAISLADLRRATRLPGQLAGRELERPRRWRQGLDMVRSELGRASRLADPAAPGWDLLTLEAGRVRAGAHQLHRLLAREFTWSLTRDPRRRKGADPDALLPEPLPLGEALVQSLPLW